MKTIPWKRVRQYIRKGVRLAYSSYIYRTRKSTLDVSEIAFDLMIISTTAMFSIASMVA